MKNNLKNRPKLPTFYNEGSEKKTQDKMFKDLCACYEWFEGFEKELLHTPIEDLVGRFPEPKHEDIPDEVTDAYQRGFMDGVHTLIDKICGKEILGVSPERGKA